MQNMAVGNRILHRIRTCNIVRNHIWLDFRISRAYIQCLTWVHREKTFIDIYGLNETDYAELLEKSLTRSGDIHQTPKGGDSCWKRQNSNCIPVLMWSSKVSRKRYTLWKYLTNKKRPVVHLCPNSGQNHKYPNSL